MASLRATATRWYASAAGPSRAPARSSATSGGATSTTTTTSSSTPPTTTSTSTDTTRHNLLTSHLKPSSLPLLSSPIQRSRSLVGILSTLPNNGIGAKVRQTKWVAKGVDVPKKTQLTGPIEDPASRKKEGHLCYWEITRARIRTTGEKRSPHGKVWGRLVWRGTPITPADKDERVRGGLKYTWDFAK